MPLTTLCAVGYLLSARINAIHGNPIASSTIGANLINRIVAGNHRPDRKARH